MLSQAEREGYATARRKTLRSPYIPFEPAGNPDAVLGSLDANFRRKVRSGRRKLDALGPVQLSQITHANADTIARFFAIERAGWKGRTGTAISSQAGTQQFYTELAIVAARHGYLTMYEMTCGGQPVAINLGFTLDSRYFVPKVANEEAYKAVGPGHLMIAETARQLSGQNVVEFDMLGHDEPYKRRWTHTYRQHFHCHIFGSGALGGALQTWTEHVMPAGRRVNQRLRLLNAANRDRMATVPVMHPLEQQ